MKEALLPLLRCPNCQHTLTVACVLRRQAEIWSGSLHCSGCDQHYPIERGLPHLFVDDERWTVKAKEAEGWVSLHKALGLYETGPDSVDHYIPYAPEEPWPKVAQNFDVALARLKLTGSERVLDLGAGRGWAAKHFAGLGCQVVALDVVADERIGLGRATALMERADLYFERLIADGENLPFNDESFDLVFCSAALHHSSQLRLLCENIGRTLRPGARLCAINEPAIGLLDDEAAILERDAGEEREHNINETRPNLLDYAHALAQGAMRLTYVGSPALEKLTVAERHHQAVNLGGVWPQLDVRALRTTYYQASEYLRKRLVARRRSTYAADLALLPADHAPFLREILLWGGGDLLLMAEKQASTS